MTRPPPRPGPWSLLVAGAAGAVLLAHASTYLPFFADDGFISLRYADRLLAGHGLTWTDGPPVEGYSDLLWVLGCAALGALGVDLVDAARALGGACALATVAAVVVALRGPTAAHRVAQVVAALLLATSGPLAAWTVGGLEAPMVAAALAGSVAVALAGHDAGRLSARGRVALALAQVALVLARADGLLLALAVAAGLLLAGRASRGARALAAAAAIPALATALGQLGFRRVVYDDWLPNTAYAKVGLSARRLGEGADFLGRFAVGHVALVGAVALALGVALARRRGRAVIVAVPLVAWVAYVGVLGGDVFPAWRPLVPALALAALLVGEGAVASGGSTVGLVAASVALLGAGAWQERGDAELGRARDERWEWEAAPIGRTLKAAVGDRAPLLAVEPAGALPYFSGLPALDLFGLNDRWLAHHRPDSFGRGVLGHELGDGAYAWSRAPDLVVFGLPRGQRDPHGRGGRELVETPGWDDAYALVTIRTPFVGPSGRVQAEVWVRRDAARLGVEATADAARVPGLVLAEAPAFARPDDAGRLVAEVPAGAAITPRLAPLPPGRWTVTAEGDGCTVAPEVLEIGDVARVTVHAGPDAPCVLAALRLVRAPATLAGG